MLRKHGLGDEDCAGAGLPAVGELTEIHVGSVAVPDPAVALVTPAQQQRVASVA